MYCTKEYGECVGQSLGGEVAHPVVICRIGATCKSKKSQPVFEDKNKKPFKANLDD
jgi:hypothetical protein